MSATTPELQSDVILRDGSTLRLRAPAAGDSDALQAFFSGLSERSLYLRFHGLRRVDRTLVEHYVEPDWTDRGVLVGVAGENRVVAVAEFMRLRDESSAEVAFAVADEPAAVGTNQLEELLLPLRSLGADLGEPGRDHTKRLDAALNNAFGGGEHMLHRQADHGQVDELRQLLDRPVAAYAADGLAGAVEGVRGALEIGGEHVPEQLPADRAAPP